MRRRAELFMKILAFEFATHYRTVAIIDTDRSTERIVADETRAEPLALVDRCLNEAQIHPPEIDCLAVGIGPGSYTGVRAGIALAQGWQLARGVKLAAIGTIDSMAAEAQDRGWRGTLEIVMDAQREELYLARFELSDETFRCVEDLKIVKAAQLGDRSSLAGPEVLRWFPSGRVLLPTALQTAKLAAARGTFMAGEEIEPIYLRPVAFVKAPAPSIHY